MTRIAIADDHEIVRNGLAMVIEMQEEMEVVRQASSYAELADTLAQTDVDLLILDLNLGDVNGLGAIENVIAAHPELPVLVLSAYPEKTYALRAFKSGASGYLNKAVVSSELIDAISSVIEGKKYISHTFEEDLEYGTSLEKEELDLNTLLSKREFEVLSLIAGGYTSKEIAQALDLSPKTVSTYKTRIMEKLMVKTSSQLFRFAYERLAPSS
ncbi:MAG: hypothetical protein B5M46_00540 [Epsilonproteobacteria bacterium 4484_20]|nr:MAG: hypothetical protein B5M46_00540 [Epsilonproteobacteria bacterium 4484_20]